MNYGDIKVEFACMQRSLKENHGRGTQEQLYHSLGHYKDVSRLEENVLVARYEEGHSEGGEQVFGIPKGQDRTPKTFR